MKIIIFIIIVFIMSCSYSDNEMIGIYTPSNYKNTYDTIELSSNNVYYRKVYDRNKKLVLKIKGRWALDKDILEFYPPYFFNLDRDLTVFPELLKDTVSNGIGFIGKTSKGIEFCVGHFAADIPNQNCYRKIKGK